MHQNGSKASNTHYFMSEVLSGIVYPVDRKEDFLFRGVCCDGSSSKGVILNVTENMYRP